MYSVHAVKSCTPDSTGERAALSVLEALRQQRHPRCFLLPMTRCPAHGLFALAHFSTVQCKVTGGNYGKNFASLNIDGVCGEPKVPTSP